MIRLGILLCLFQVFALPTDAFAYLDPGSTSFLLQAVLAGIVSGLVAVKLYFRRIVSFFRGVSTARTESDQGGTYSEADDPQSDSRD